jgi:PTH2 family peptidyl-tRNA hydrolase
MGSEHKQVIILRKANRDEDRLVISLDERVEPWLCGRFTKICVSVNSEAELLAVHEKARAAGVLTSLILDAGLTEFGGVPTHTAVAVGPDHASKVDQITGELPLL